MLLFKFPESPDDLSLIDDIMVYVSKLYSDRIADVNNVVLDCIHCTDQALVKQIGEYLILSGGKRIRPLLTLMTANMLGYRDKEPNGVNDVLLAAAVEFIHTATLLHDDVIDNSLVRRFRPSANALWGDKSSILVGDYLFSQAFQLMVRTGSIEALDILARASSVISKGEVEQLDLLRKREFLSYESYFKVISEKTAELFGAASMVGAIVALDSEMENRSDIMEACYGFGVALGQIFQIKDDLLDYFSTEDVLGKPIGDDFFEGKITLPVILLNRCANDTEKNYIHDVFITQNSRSKEDFDKVVKLMMHYDIIHQISAISGDIILNTSKVVDSIHIISVQYKNILKQLLQYAAYRKA